MIRYLLIYLWSFLIRRRKCCDATRYWWRQTGRETYLEGREVLPCKVNTKNKSMLVFFKIFMNSKKWAGGLQETDKMKSGFRVGIITVTAEPSWLGEWTKHIMFPNFLVGLRPPPPAPLWRSPCIDDCTRKNNLEAWGTLTLTYHN